MTVEDLLKENRLLKNALRFYADQEHLIIADKDAWDTVSGEPGNFLCDEAGTATIEDGSIARCALNGKFILEDTNSTEV